MADSKDQTPDDKNAWPHVDRRKGPKDRRVNQDRRDGNRVVTEETPRRQYPDRRKS